MYAWNENNAEMATIKKRNWAEFQQKFSTFEPFFLTINNVIECFFRISNSIFILTPFLPSFL